MYPQRSPIDKGGRNICPFRGFIYTSSTPGY